MARCTGFNCVISVDANDISGMSNEVTLNLETVDNEEVGSFAEAWELFVGGLVTKWSLDVKGRWDGDAAEIDSILFGLLGGGIVPLDHLRPEGTGAGKVEYSADSVSDLIGVYLMNYSVPVPRTGAVKYSASFQGSGELSRAAQGA